MTIAMSGDLMTLELAITSEGEECYAVTYWTIDDEKIRRTFTDRREAVACIARVSPILVRSWKRQAGV